jgi:hypothetical protein
MAFAIVHGIKSQLVGIGTAGPVGTGTARPTTDSTASTVTTTSLAQSINRGKVHAAITAVDTGVKIVNALITLLDNTSTPVVISIAAFTPVAADQVAGQGVNLVAEFCTDLNILQAACKVTPTGAKTTTSGAIEYQCDVELCGNDSTG